MSRGRTLLSVLACRFGISIDRAIGAPGHGKDVVDALNATDKVYSMVVHADGSTAKLSLAKECQRLQQLELPWQNGVEREKQPRFASSTTCQFWSIFKPRRQEKGAWVDVDGPGLNDWRIVSLEAKKDSDPAEEEEALADAYAGITAMMAEQIAPKQYGAFSTQDPDADGYYIVVFTSTPYALQDDVVLTQYEPGARPDLREEQAAAGHVEEE